MRNAALARVLVARGASQVVVALCPPAAHRTIWRRWAETTPQLALPGVTFANLDAATVVKHHPTPPSVAELPSFDSRGSSLATASGLGAACPARRRRVLL